MAADISSLRAELQRVQTMLYDVRAQKDRLQYEIDTIHHKNGTYRIVKHLRNEIQRLTISKLILIQSTALEMDRLRKIIRSLSKGEKYQDINSIDDYSQNIRILQENLPSPTPTSPPPNFSWKETFNIDLNEDEEDDIHSNDNKLDREDDIKIPEMNLNLEDGAENPISILHQQSSSSDNENEQDSDLNDNESNDDDNDYVIERVASPEAGHDDYDPEFDDNDDENEIAMAEKKSLFADDYNIMNSDDMTDHEIQNDHDGGGGGGGPLSDHHIHDDNCQHNQHSIHPHDASPQLQFAGDGDDLNQIHGVATDAPILPPSTDGDIYGEEDHKFVISIRNEDDEKLQLDLDEEDLDDTHALISPKEKSKNSSNALLANDDDMENLELISEMGDDDRNPSPNINDNIANRGPSPSPIAIEEEDEKQIININEKARVSKIKVSQNNHNEDDNEANVPTTPDQTHILQSSDDDMIEAIIDIEHNDDDDDDDDEDDDEDDNDEYSRERDDEFEYSLSRSLMVSTPTSRLKKSHGYDVSTEVFNNPRFGDIDQMIAGLALNEEDNIDNENNPRKPSRPKSRPTQRARSKSLSDRNVPLLNGLRLGEMDVHIEICEMSDLIDLLSIICRAMTMLPYGLKEFRNKLLFSLQKRMCDSYYLAQHFTFFLNSYRDCFAVSRLFRDHICMESIIELQRLNTFVTRPGGGHVRTPSNKAYVRTPSSRDNNINNNNNTDYDDEKAPNYHPTLTSRFSQTRGDIVEYFGSNVVEYFRLPLMYPQLNKTILVSNTNEICCPLTGKSNVERLEIRHIFKSNAKPLLIDCYLRNKFTPISSFILKYGDDLRRDAAVLMMFRFMNILWSDNSCRYNNKQIAALTYKCFPLGPDYGIIELIPNCQTMKDITEKYVTNNKKKLNKLSDDVLNTLIATCAGSFMAAYIMGIRDRHYDNILVTDEGTIFHIDFGYMLGEKVSGVDTAKFAITSDLCKLMGSKWKEFVEISVQCWVILRENHQELLDFAKLAFSFLYPQEEVQEFLKETLLLDLSITDARTKIHKRIISAPKKIKTKMKNWVHSVAAARDRSSSGSLSRSHSYDYQKDKHQKDKYHKEKEKKETKNGIFSSFLAPRRKLSKSSSTEILTD